MESVVRSGEQLLTTILFSFIQQRLRSLDLIKGFFKPVEKSKRTKAYLNLKFALCRALGKSDNPVGVESSYVAVIICPLDLNRFNWSAKIWRGTMPPAPRFRQPYSGGTKKSLNIFTLQWAFLFQDYSTTLLCTMLCRKKIEKTKQRFHEFPIWNLEFEIWNFHNFITDQNVSCFVVMKSSFNWIHFSYFTYSDRWKFGFRTFRIGCWIRWVRWKWENKKEVNVQLNKEFTFHRVRFGDIALNLRRILSPHGKKMFWITMNSLEIEPPFLAPA